MTMHTSPSSCCATEKNTCTCTTETLKKQPPQQQQQQQQPLKKESPMKSFLQGLMLKHSGIENMIVDDCALTHTDLSNCFLSRALSVIDGGSEEDLQVVENDNKEPRRERSINSHESSNHHYEQQQQHQHKSAPLPLIPKRRSFIDC